MLHYTELYMYNIVYFICFIILVLLAISVLLIIYSSVIN